jgi:hypothetical protein
MATLDDSVRNLERFVGLLTVATGELERVGKDLADSQKDLSQLDHEAAAEGGGLNDRLEDLESALESAEENATGALQDLHDTAVAAQETIDESQERLEVAVREVEERTRDASDAVEDAHSRLLDQGFEALGRVVDEVRTEAETAREAAAGLTEELVIAVRGFEAECEPAWNQGEAALDEALSDAQTLDASLEAAADECVEGLESEAHELEGACTSLELDVTTIYQGLAETADAEQQALCETLRAAAQAAASTVETDGQERLELPARTVEEQGLTPLAAELAELAAVIADGALVKETLPPLTADLAKCQAVIGQINDLLQAVE